MSFREMGQQCEEGSYTAYARGPSLPNRFKRKNFPGSHLWRFSEANSDDTRCDGKEDGPVRVVAWIMTTLGELKLQNVDANWTVSDSNGS